MKSAIDFRREPRGSRPVKVGKVTIGGGGPVVVQSMLTSDTLDTEACVRETLELVEARRGKSGGNSGQITATWMRCSLGS
jgi:hypothetical protein